MCKQRQGPGPCWNLKCPHNLFWEKLMLNGNKIHMTKKALEIRNCCCLICKPWTEGEIKAVWGLPKAEIIRCEGMAWKKIKGKNCPAQLN